MAFAPQDPRIPDPSDPVVQEARVDYVPTPISVTRARQHATRLIADWGHPALADDTALIVSELATNAMRHGHVPGRLFRVQLTLTKTRLRIAVSDPRSERLPRPRRPSPRDAHGRGLLIVRALADRWGVRERTVGKEIWVELDLTAPRPKTC
ncbi:ATP-binding protein [Streptomyces rapamycinicus]|uniref:Regulatory protein n=2 Tax=Streptomyces rapamycinicus TaxID=1226757 RepID=A0A0A0N6S4_STRRN|nr:ATP-binding protein [Streptomyces rapamycinicus]AGP54922.1 regulatory protein [Streptomyces rapamycinicus NRRL 5491]MBB4782445.1 anti-sigma regulatory factor (Ser/Thr protein kinase) [Streptomyces rapamycinicus]RLV82071.1 regulatory protein [Streptomyces rapamycinicus NRRL 5491]UTO62954.1 ATP-binding protein [Streptomyces rapamycinicus]UTP30912.1 ATP-binding protein [Streptomyces rapamycinicus NRRL 5491]